MLNRHFMPNTPESPRPLTPDEIADLADHGGDVSRFFTRRGKMMPPIQRVNEFQPSGGDQETVAAGAGSAAYGTEGALDSLVTP
jgi:hypothetical protein